MCLIAIGVVFVNSVGLGLVKFMFVVCCLLGLVVLLVVAAVLFCCWLWILCGFGFYSSCCEFGGLAVLVDASMVVGLL